MSLYDFLRSLFGTKPATPGPIPSSPVTPTADNTNEPPQICTPKVLLIIYNPTMEAASLKKIEFSR